MKKLYVARKTITIYAIADDDHPIGPQLRESMQHAEQNDGGSESFDYESITSKPTILEGEWDEHSLIYGVDTDVTLGSVIDGLPK